MIIVKNSQKTVKTAKNDHWCTNRYSSTKTVTIVYELSKAVKQQKCQVVFGCGKPQEWITDDGD